MSQNSAGDRLEWSVRPFMDNIRRTLIVVVIILVCGAMVYFAFKDVFLMILSLLILFVSLHTYFTRTTYCLDDDQIVVRGSIGKSVKKWSDFKRYYVDRKGVTLSPFAKPSKLEPFRSVRLLFGSNKDEVVAFISKRLDNDSGHRSG
jgi:hypothetical protein